jgi:PadR family transcriptional regulator PadR
MGRNALGSVEQLVLLSILHLEDGAYGVTIVDEIASRTGRQLSRAAVYIALRRLDQKGAVTSSMADPTPERGGRAKRFYHVEPTGIEQLAQSRRELLGMWKGLLPVLQKN